MAHSQREVRAPMTDNQTSNSCPDCGKEWMDKVPTPGLLHKLRICDECWKKGVEEGRYGKNMDPSAN